GFTTVKSAMSASSRFAFLFLILAAVNPTAHSQQVIDTWRQVQQERSDVYRAAVGMPPAAEGENLFLSFQELGDFYKSSGGGYWNNKFNLRTFDFVAKPNSFGFYVYSVFFSFMLYMSVTFPGMRRLQPISLDDVKSSAVMGGTALL